MIDVRVAVVVGAAGLGLTGCGSTGRSASTAKSAGLSQFFGGGETPEESQARMVAQMRKGQEKVAACTRPQGFVYKPFVNFSPSSFVGPKVGEEVAWKRKHGYGTADLSGQVSRPPEQPVDPNATIRAASSKADQAAYDKALFGFDPANPPSGVTQPLGCMNKAFGGADEETQVLQAQMSAKYEALTKRIAVDPRVVGLNRKWSACMKERGFVVSSTKDLFEKILGPAQQKFLSSGLAGRSPETEQPGPEVGGAGGFSAAKIEGFREFELKVANADADCRSQSDTNAMNAVQKEYEVAFVSENRALLEKLKATQNA